MRMRILLTDGPDAVVAHEVALDLIDPLDVSALQEDLPAGPIVALCEPDDVPTRGEFDYVLAVSPVPVVGADDHLPAPLNPAALRHRLEVARRLLEAENGLRALAPLRLALDLTPEMMFRVDFSARIRDVNAAACRILGHSREALLRMSIRDLSPNHDPATWPDRWNACRAAGSLQFPSYQRAADGRILPVDVSLTFLDGRGRGEDFIVSFVRDLSEKKQQEASLLLADRLHALGLLAATTSHEIASPLTYLMSALSYLEAELSREGEAPDRLGMQHATQEALDGARRVLRIANGLKAFARSGGGDTGDLPEAPATVRLDGPIQTACRMTAKLVGAAAALTVESLPDLYVQGDSQRLVQVLVNLLLNAAQAMPSRHRSENRIALRTARRGREVAIEVQDNGAGIPAAVRARIFDPFFTTKPAGLGTGLGLSVCDGIVRGLGGRIEVESEPGAGTTFRVVLPAAKPSPRLTAPVGDAGPRLRVLVVDDEVNQLRAYARTLGRHAVVATASTADDALDQLRGSTRYDVVLCDVNLGDGSGIDVRRWVEQHRPSLLPAFYLVTGGVYTDDAVAYLASRGLSPLEKPVEAALLADILERHGHTQPQADRTPTPGG